MCVGEGGREKEKEREGEGERGGERFLGVFVRVLGNKRLKTADLVQFLFLRLGNQYLKTYFFSFSQCYHIVLSSQILSHPKLTSIHPICQGLN